ncbi:YchJ family protein [Vibrio breoganii]|uniref:YchJ family protein n=1 Tax=Vibrio breoganii TaxID=553239 RepID=UPI000C826662|nr:YchJ family protein [Vibrio breoganii]
MSKLSSSLCRCHSQKAYQDCCQPIHTNPSNALTPEQLMRARYCAHELRLVEFVVHTYHPSCNAAAEADVIAESVHGDWKKLEVVSTEPGKDDYEGYVTFNAYFIEDKRQYSFTEKSRFIKEDGQWFYIDGEMYDYPLPVKKREIGRNDPCVCGSGKKYKKCCGS